MVKKLMKALEPYDPLFFEEPVAYLTIQAVGQQRTCGSLDSVSLASAARTVRPMRAETRACGEADEIETWSPAHRCWGGHLVFQAHLLRTEQRHAAGG